MQSNKGILIAGLKYLTIVSLYIALSGFWTALADSVTPIYCSFAYIFVCAMIGCALRKIKGIWIIPLILGAGAFYIEYLLGGLSINLLWILPIYIYCLVFNIKELYYFDKYSAVKSTPLVPAVAWIVPFFALFGSGLSAYKGADNGSAAFGILFVMCGIILLRYSRHKNTAVDTSEFRRMNIKALLLIGSTAVVFSVLGLALWYGVSGILLFIGSLGKKTDIVPLEIPTFSPEPTETPTYIGIRTPQPEIGGVSEHRIDPQTVGIVIAVAVLGVLAYYIIFKLRKRGELSETVNIKAKKTAGEKDNRIKKKQFGKDVSNRNTVRKCYRKFIRLCRDNLITVNASSTAKEIKDAAVEMGFSHDECDGLYRIYLLARYSDAAVSDIDAKNATALYKRIKSIKLKKTGKKKNNNSYA